jgi:uncharacterized protein
MKMDMVKKEGMGAIVNLLLCALIGRRKNSLSGKHRKIRRLLIGSMVAAVLCAPIVSIYRKQVRQDALISAIRRDDLFEVKRQLIQGTEVNAPYPLTGASASLSLPQRLVQLLQRARSSKVTYTTPLLEATSWRIDAGPWTMTAQAEIIQALLAAGANANVLDAEGYTPLCNAVVSQDLKAVQTLVEHGADVNARCQRGLTALHCTRPGLVFTYLLEHGADVNARDDREFTPLMHIAKWGDAEAIRHLLKRGAEVNAREKELGSTALEMAAVEGNVDAVKVLLEAGTDPRIRRKDGATALKMADDWASVPHPQQYRIIKRLLKRALKEKERA